MQVRKHYERGLFYVSTAHPRQWAILSAMLVLCALIYYLGQLIDFAGWTSVRYGVFYGVHDAQRLVFLVPVIYAGQVYRIKGAIIVTLIAYIIFLPRAFLLSPYPDPILRAALFAIAMGLIGALTGKVQNERDSRLRLEKLLAEEKTRLQGMLEIMEEGVMLIDGGHHIRFLNRSMEKDFGPGAGSLCYQYLHGFDEPCGLMCKMDCVLGGATENWEYNLPDGRIYEVIAAPFLDSDGVMCQLGVFRHITQRKKVELELIELNRLKSELVSNVSHELRSPLTSIKGIISSLLQKDVDWDDETREMLLTGISEETDRLASLVTNLLNMSKIEAGVWKPDMTSRNVADVIIETLDQVKWVQKQRHFELELEPNLPDSYFDYNQIKQVLINLLENAAAYSEENSVITVRARAVDGEVEVSISDQGVGIAPEYLSLIFEKFHRGSEERRRPGGTGLGLAICKALIEAHGGRIEVESEPDSGSTFYFSLPVPPVEEE